MSFSSPANNNARPQQAAPASPNSASIDELARVFNTAVVATRVGPVRDFSGELYELVQSPAFRAIMNAVRQHARLQGITERQAAEQVIQTFRKVDEVWSSYVFQEGVDRLRGQNS